MTWIYFLAVLMSGVVGLGVNLLGLPGLWLMVLGALLYVVMTGELGLWGFLVVFGLALVAEVLEAVLGGVAAKTAGGSKRAMVGAILGGIAGAIVGTPFLPVVGTIVGACAGSFLGAALVERVWLGRTTREAMQVGTGAAAGKFLGIASKSVVGVLMLVVLVIWGWPRGGGAGGTPLLPGPVMVPAVVPAEGSGAPAAGEVPSTLPG